MSDELIGFPEGTIFEKPVRMPIIFSGAGAVAISKPAGVSAEKILVALRQRLSDDKGFSARLHAEKPQIVFSADEEASGIVLFADKACPLEYETWRNALGSFLIEHTFLFLAKPLHHRVEAQSVTCTLPIAKHSSEPRALISHKTGKKSCTIFTREESFPPWELWRAQTTYPRFHQIRLHATESGLPIVGEDVYENVSSIKISDLRANNRLNKGDDKTFYPSLCLHLASAKILQESTILRRLCSQEHKSPNCIPEGSEPLGSAPEGVQFVDRSHRNNLLRITPPRLCDRTIVGEQIRSTFPTELTISAPLPSGFESLLKKLRAKAKS